MELHLDAIPQVALTFMNRDHADFIELRQALLDALTGSANLDLEKMLTGFLEHTREHFAEEERHMQLAGFPALPVHKGEHDAVLADMAMRIAQWRSGRDDVALHVWLDEPVGQWFVNHVRTMDSVTAGFVHARIGDQSAV